MKRFPVRLQFALARARLFHGRSPVRYLRPGDILHSDLQQPVSHQAMRDVIRDRYSILWLGGDEAGQEPLEHPGIGHLAKLIVNSGHFLFVETSAITLRQRIHEFQPCKKFYFVIRFCGSEATHDRLMGRAGAFAAALEGIRAAQLSGFYVCARVHASAVAAAELTELFAELQRLDLDGLMIGGQAPVLDAAGVPVSSNGWSKLSELVEAARRGRLAPPLPQNPTTTAVENSAEAGCEEVAQI
jgi:hypothetical protein